MILYPVLPGFRLKVGHVPDLFHACQAKRTMGTPAYLPAGEIISLHNGEDSGNVHGYLVPAQTIRETCVFFHDHHSAPVCRMYKSDELPILPENIMYLCS